MSLTLRRLRESLILRLFLQCWYSFCFSFVYRWDIRCRCGVRRKDFWAKFFRANLWEKVPHCGLTLIKHAGRWGWKVTKQKIKMKVELISAQVIICIRLLGQRHFIFTRLPATSCQYTNKYSVPAVVHTLKTGDLALSKKDGFTGEGEMGCSNRHERYSIMKGLQGHAVDGS